MKKPVDKDEVAKVLRERGFNSSNESGVIITKFLFGNTPEYYKEQSHKVKEIFNELGYEASKGFHIVKQENF